MSENPGFSEEEGGPIIDPESVRPSIWDIEVVAPVIGDDFRRAIITGGFDPGAPDNYKRDIERLVEKGEEYDRQREAEAAREREEADRERAEAEREREEAARERDEAERERAEADREREEADRQREEAERESEAGGEY
jgi:hypothetical protein